MLKNKLFCILLFLTVIFKTELLAQTYRFTFHNTKLSDALLTISSQLNIKVAFDSKKLGSVIIDKDVSGNSPDEVINDILQNSSFRFNFRYNRYLIVDNTENSKEDTSERYQLIGTVTDQESGEYLPFATVILYDEDLHISSTDKGSFSIKDLNFNPVHLHVSYIGYVPIDTTFYFDEAIKTYDVRLRRQIRSIDPVVIIGESPKIVELRNDVDFATTINTSKLIDLPSIAETDIFRSLQLLPGISYSENSQGLNIRGGSNDQNLVLFDGQNMYNLSHYFGLISAINPNVVKDIEVFKGGFDSRYGERVSGIVNITGKTGNQNKAKVYGDLNILSGNLTTEIPVGKKISLIAAVRRSYPDIYSTGIRREVYNRNMNLFRGDSSTIVSETNPSFSFYDYNAKISFRPSNVETFSLSLFGGRDFLGSTFSGGSDKLLINSANNNKWGNYGLSASWSRQWNESLFTTMQIGTSGYNSESSDSTLVIRTSLSQVDPKFLPDSVNNFSTYSDNWIRDKYLTIQNSYRTHSNNLIEFGLLFRQNSLYYYRDAERKFVYDNMDQQGRALSGYVQNRINVDGRLSLKPGIRISHTNIAGGLYFEPRFSADFKISDKFSARIAGGRYYQFINQVISEQETGYNRNFWVMADDRKHPVVSSKHFIAGSTFRKGRFLFDAEVYYKSFDGLQENIFVSPFLEHIEFPQYFPGALVLAQNPPSVYINGKGKAYGSDLMVLYKDRLLNSWLSLSYGRSLRNFISINYGRDIPSQSDQPFRLTWTNMIALGNWNFGAVFYYSTGKPYISFTGNPRPGIVSRDYSRLPDNFRSDLSTNYNFSILGSKFKAGLTLINIFNNHNYLDVNTRKFDFENSSFSETSLVRSQPLSLNLFIHFDF
ncbi:MAG TPA: TonB-dependent receptor plug domain-containing protein [Bacteroidales bacterium]|nr:TonB-dependent receptor plug domain-containing protein [Bacteroidales bacterium]